jgi:hypothetical protein
MMLVTEISSFLHELASNKNPITKPNNCFDL